VSILIVFIVSFFSIYFGAFVTTNWYQSLGFIWLGESVRVRVRVVQKYCSKAVEHCSSERSTVHRRYCSPNAVIVQKRWSTVHRSGALFIGGTVHRTLLLFIWYCSLTLFIEYCSPTLYNNTVHRILLLFIWYCSLNTVHSTVHWHCTRVLFQNYGKESSVNRQHCCLRRLGFKWDRCDPSSLSWELS
jgi:hypothetical protein